MGTQDYVVKRVHCASGLECVLAQRAGRGHKSLSLLGNKKDLKAQCWLWLLAFFPLMTNGYSCQHVVLRGCVNQGGSKYLGLHPHYSASALGQGEGGREVAMRLLSSLGIQAGNLSRASHRKQPIVRDHVSFWSWTSCSTEVLSLFLEVEVS